METVWELVIPHITDPTDLSSVSLVSTQWYQTDRLTRKHVSIANCYSATPSQLSTRFPQLESLKIKGKPRASMFELIPEDWGGYAGPWVDEVITSFLGLKALHFRRMVVTDEDLDKLSKSRVGKGLEVFKLDRCSGFSTYGIKLIASRCRNLRNLCMEQSEILENDVEWLHELASNNTVLEHLNFYLSELFHVGYQELELIARNCPSLTSVKTSDCDLSDLIVFFRHAASLEEFVGGSFPPKQFGEVVLNEQIESYSSLVFPPRLSCLGLTDMGKTEIQVVYPIALRLKKLDLICAMLDTEGHCLLLQRCPNLEVLEARNVIGDRGLEVIAEFCKKMKRLRIERGADEEELGDEEGMVSQRGLIALAQGCLDLEHLAVYVYDITNSTLEYMGANLKSLRNFRLVLLERKSIIADFPLDNGVRSLLIGCDKLRRFALCLRPGGLTDVGLSYIGRHSPNVRWMLLICAGRSDAGLLEFSRGCPKLQKLELRGCSFSDHALAIATLQLTSLKFLWVEGYRSSGNGGRELLSMVRPYWHIELIPARQYVQEQDGGHMIVEHHSQILGYYSLAGQRTDCPASVTPFNPAIFNL